MKIKQKKTLSCVCGVFYPIARIDYVSHHCVLLQTQKTNFFISGTRTSFFLVNFLESTSTFFLSQWKHTFLGARPPKITQAFFH